MTTHKDRDRARLMTPAQALELVRAYRDCEAVVDSRDFAQAACVLADEIARRDAEYERGRQDGRADVAKYSRAIGEIEAVLGIVGAKPLPETVAAVTALAQHVPLKS